mmetsp:Transcript_46203/g.119068  ORF Transcript_46203/g.119068 Transcript_46203/m.119068 type:complete len:114 (-) Transcript_46203:322-663(-)
MRYKSTRYCTKSSHHGRGGQEEEEEARNSNTNSHDKHVIAIVSVIKPSPKTPTAATTHTTSPSVITTKGSPARSCQESPAHECTCFRPRRRREGPGMKARGSGAGHSQTRSVR